MATQPWLFGFVFGIKQASIIGPKDAARIIHKSENPVIAIGSKAETDVLPSGKNIIDYVIEISKIKNIPIVVTSPLYRKVRELYEDVHYIPTLELMNYLLDPNWKLKGDKPHDLIIISSFEYYFISHVINSIKHLARHIKILSIDRYYQPNAHFSLPNQISLTLWEKNLKELIETLKELSKS